MKLSDFTLGQGNFFVAMEYHTLILNRTLLVTEKHLVGIVANGGCQRSESRRSDNFSSNRQSCN